MDVEKTIQFLMENAAAHDARIAELERNSVLIQQALLRLAESHQRLEAETHRSIQETQRSLRELGEKTDERIASLVRAIAALAEREANGPRRQ